MAENKITEFYEGINGDVLLVEDVFDREYKYNSLKKEIIFVLGINSLSEIKELHLKKNKDSIIIVIEPNLAFFNHVLTQKNMSIFKNDDIYLFADNHVENANSFLQPLLSNLDILAMAKNVSFYITNYYRKYDFELSKKCLALLRQFIRSNILIFGNDIADSLQGLEQNLNNLKWIMKSKNPVELKNTYTNVPAIVVSAGPSLNKNIQYLKDARGKSIIIAVDTILGRLIDEGIIPDFVCSIERISEVYDYFFKDRSYPKEVTLVGPPLLDGRVFESFQGELLLPFRTEVNEYRWLQNVLNIKDEIGMLMGISCAHVAFGIAEYLGCSPIILVGQDLAYGTKDGQTHASGTTYDNLAKKPINNKNDDIVEGYNGDEVKTTKTWIQFKNWFEAQISEKNLHVINATEGGAKIYHTEQKSLKEALDIYCIDYVSSIKKAIDQARTYDINVKEIKSSLLNEVKYILDLKEKCLIQYKELIDTDINATDFSRKLNKISKKINRISYIIDSLTTHQLLMHNLQSTIIQYLWKKNSIEQILSVENFNLEKKAQIQFLVPVIATLTAIEEIINKVIEEQLDELEWQRNTK
ncbi:motility associated factor glycosyltransferase family protein [Viridibacillus arvi]|uniref:motility associated factor glycosyltransferase family protein n=1 Tax=Viridibacillus arvi TaxID=263475 RepID=UPI003D2B7165